MRKYPAGGVASIRIPKGNKDVILGGGKLTVPAGCAVHMPITAVQNCRANWERPEAFLPERFLEVCLPPLLSAQCSEYEAVVMMRFCQAP